jgi:hypothetical protein
MDSQDQNQNFNDHLNTEEEIGHHDILTLAKHSN